MSKLRAIQLRFADLDKPGVLINGDMGDPPVGMAEVQTYCALDEGCAAACKNLMRAAVRQHPGGSRLTARAYHRVLKLSRTIADLAGEESIQAQHLAEALQHRPRSIT